MPNWPDGSYFWMAAPAVAGSSLYVVGERISRPAGAVEGEYTARFTVGAGDALTAAFAAGLLARLDPIHALERGNAAGAIVASRLACADDMPTLAELEAMVAVDGAVQ